MLRPVQQTASTVREWLEAGRQVAAGTLVGVEGSAPLNVGASVYIDADGTIEGSITGGCVESAVAQEALAMLQRRSPPRLVTYGISDERAPVLYLRPVDDGDLTATYLDVFERIWTDALPPE